MICQSLKHNVLAIVFIFSTAACGTGVQPSDTRADTRASISGRIILSDVAGLNDASRVRIDLGKGEGGSNIEADGKFSITDLEPDVYELEVTYIGGLTNEASTSAYQPYSLRILATEGGSIHLADIELQLGIGRVSGQVAHPSEDTLPHGATVTLLKRHSTTGLEEGPTSYYEETEHRADVNADGTFTLDDITVGYYEAVVAGEGLRGCLGLFSVTQDAENVALDAFDLASTHVSFLPGTGQVFEPIEGNEWHLQEEGITINIGAGFASQMRWWKGTLTETERPNYSAISETLVLTAEDLNENETHLSFQFKDACGYVSPVAQLLLVKDIEPPLLEELILNNGALYSQSSTVHFDLNAFDAFSPQLEMRLNLCTLSPTNDALSSIGPEDYNCTEEITAQSWVPLASNHTVTFPNDQNWVGLQVQVRDVAGNETDLWGRALIIDHEAPQGSRIGSSQEGIQVNGGDVLTNNTNLQVTVAAQDNASGVSHFKISPNSSCTGGFWQDWNPVVENEMTVQLLVENRDDTTQDVSVLFRDFANNDSDCFSDSIVVDTEPLTLTGFTFNKTITHDRSIDFSQIDFIGSGGCEQLELSENAGFSANLTSTYNCNLSQGTYRINENASEGLKTIFARLIDKAGNASAPLSATILLDTVAPILSNVSFVSGEGSASSNVKYTASKQLALSLEYTGDGNQLNYLLQNNNISCPTAISNYTQTANLTPTLILTVATEGIQKICARITDAAGNVSAIRFDSITVDQTPPPQPGVTKEQIIGANHACANVTPNTNPNTMNDFWKWEVRENGGDWKTTDADDQEIPASQAAIKFNLAQDSDNILEIRAVDNAGNRGESSQVYAEEISSFFVPTNLEIKQICNGGEYAILKDMDIKHTAYATSTSVRFVEFPQHGLLNLKTYEYRPLSSIMTSFDLCGGTSDTDLYESQVVDAACSAKEGEPALLIASPKKQSGCMLEDGVNYTQASTRLWVYPDPFGAPTQPGIELTEAVEDQNANFAAINSIDALKWGNNNEFTALTTVTQKSTSNYTHRLHLLTGDQSSSYSATLGSMLHNISRPFGMNYQHLRGLHYWSNYSYGFLFKSTTASTNWTVRQECTNTSVCEDDGDTVTTFPASQFTDNDGHYFSPYGISVVPGLNYHWSTSVAYAPSINFLFVDNVGGAYAYRYDHSSIASERKLLGEDGPAAKYPAIFDRGYRKVGWVDTDNPRVIYDDDTYGNNPKTFRHSIKRDRPVFGNPNREDATNDDGESFVIYHTESLSEGIVFGYEDNAGCAQ